MGTNYYHKKNICDECGRSDEPVHIGLSSAGWRFMFYTDNGLPQNWAEWRERLSKGHIEDEYGQAITLEEFEQLVEAKKDGKADVDGIGCCAYLDKEGHIFLEYEFS